MRRNIYHISFHSIYFKLVAAAFAILLPVWAYFLYNNLYAISVVRTQVAISNKKLVSLYMQDIDNRLQSVEIYLSGILSSDSNLIDMQYLQDKYDRESAKLKAFQKISNDIAEYNYINSIFVYQVGTQDYFSVYSFNSVEYSVQQKINQYMKDLILNNPNINDILSQGYFPREIDNKYYLFRIFRSGDMFIGAWVSADYLRVPLNLINKGASLFVTSDGKPMNNIDFIKKNGSTIKFVVP